MKRVYEFRTSDNGLVEVIPEQVAVVQEIYLNTVISFEDYLAVQDEKGKRSSIDEDTNKRKATQYYSKDVLNGLFVCAECGAHYRRITRPTGEVVWRCANKVEHGKPICHHATSLPENGLKQAGCQMLGISGFDPEAVKENLECVQVLSDGTLAPEFVQREYQELSL